MIPIFPFFLAHAKTHQTEGVEADSRLQFHQCFTITYLEQPRVKTELKELLAKWRNWLLPSITNLKDQATTIYPEGLTHGNETDMPSLLNVGGTNLM